MEREYKRIPFGSQREIIVLLPQGHCTVEAVLRYHDWVGVSKTVLTLKENY